MNLERDALKCRLFSRVCVCVCLLATNSSFVGFVFLATDTQKKMPKMKVILKVFTFNAVKNMEFQLIYDKQKCCVSVERGPYLNFGCRL